MRWTDRTGRQSLKRNNRIWCRLTSIDGGGAAGGLVDWCILPFLYFTRLF